MDIFGGIECQLQVSKLFQRIKDEPAGPGICFVLIDSFHRLDCYQVGLEYSCQNSEVLKELNEIALKTAIPIVWFKQ